MEEMLMTSKSSTTTTEGSEFLPLIHPGEILSEEYLKPLGMTLGGLAGALRVPAGRVREIIRGRRRITPDTALRLARYFGTSPQFWLNLQSGYDLRAEERRTGGRVAREVDPLQRTG